MRAVVGATPYYTLLVRGAAWSGERAVRRRQSTAVQGVPGCSRGGAVVALLFWSVGRSSVRLLSPSTCACVRVHALVRLLLLHECTLVERACVRMRVRAGAVADGAGGHRAGVRPGLQGGCKRGRLGWNRGLITMVLSITTSARCCAHSAPRAAR